MKGRQDAKVLKVPKSSTIVQSIFSQAKKVAMKVFEIREKINKM